MAIPPSAAIRHAGAIVWRKTNRPAASNAEKTSKLVEMSLNIFPGLKFKIRGAFSMIYQKVIPINPYIAENAI